MLSLWHPLPPPSNAYTREHLFVFPLPLSAHDLLVELALVEGELLALEDVSVGAAGLAGTAGDDGEEATGLELLLDGGVDLATRGEAGGLLLLDGVAKIQQNECSFWLTVWADETIIDT